MINQHVSIDTSLKVLRSGIAVMGEATSYVFVVLDRAECEAKLGFGLDGRVPQDVAHDLTGWEYSYGGPGLSFTEDPVIRVYGRKVLVTQRRGWDI